MSEGLLLGRARRKYFLPPISRRRYGQYRTIHAVTAWYANGMSTDKTKKNVRVLSAPGQPMRNSAQHRDWIAYKRKWGIRAERHHPPKYEPRHAEFARKLVALGANDWEIAQALNVSAPTITTWKTKHPEFAEAMRYRDEDGTFQNDRVKRSLFHRATGYNYHSEKVMVVEGEVVRVPVVEHVPPSENAARFWLQNRDGQNWNAAQRHDLAIAQDVNVTITKDMSPKDAMAEFMKLLRAPPPLVIEHEAREPATADPPHGDGNGSD